MSSGDQKAFKKSIKKDQEEIISNFPNKRIFEKKNYKVNTSYVEDLTTDDNDEYQEPLPKPQKQNQHEILKNQQEIKHLKEHVIEELPLPQPKVMQNINQDDLKNSEYYKRFGMQVDYKTELPLKVTNSHTRDGRIIFLEEPHEYQIKLDNGQVDTNYLSVTQFIKTFLFPQFDEDEAIDNMMKSHNWQQSKYYGMSPDDIKNLWESVRSQSSQAGQQLHKSISQFYDGIDDGNSTSEFSQFIEFHRKVIEENGLVPFRAEWPIYNEDIKIAGSIDMLYQLTKNDNKKLILYDWKRTIKLQGYNKFSNGFWPVEHLPNSNFWQYSLQLNLYKDILQQKYDKEIVGMFLITLHPENLFLKSKIFIVPDLSKEIQDIKDLRLSQLDCLEKGLNIFK